MNEMITWSPGITLEQIEKEVILRAFRHYRGNKTTTSNALGISIRTLDNKLAKYEEEGKALKEKLEQEKLQREEQLKRARGNPPNNSGIIYNPHESVSPRMDSFVKVQASEVSPTLLKNEKKHK